jgi:hypothetical protein
MKQIKSCNFTFSKDECVGVINRNGDAVNNTANERISGQSGTDLWCSMECGPISLKFHFVVDDTDDSGENCKDACEDYNDPCEPDFQSGNYSGGYNWVIDKALPPWSARRTDENYIAAWEGMKSSGICDRILIKNERFCSYGTEIGIRHKYTQFTSGAGTDPPWMSSLCDYPSKRNDQDINSHTPKDQRDFGTEICPGDWEPWRSTGMGPGDPDLFSTEYEMVLDVPRRIDYWQQCDQMRSDCLAVNKREYVYDYFRRCKPDPGSLQHRLWSIKDSKKCFSSMGENATEARARRKVCPTDTPPTASPTPPPTPSRRISVFSAEAPTAFGVKFPDYIDSIERLNVHSQDITYHGKAWGMWCQKSVNSYASTDCRTTAEPHKNHVGESFMPPIKCNPSLNDCVWEAGKYVPWKMDTPPQLQERPSWEGPDYWAWFGGDSLGSQYGTVIKEMQSDFDVGLHLNPGNGMPYSQNFVYLKSHADYPTVNSHVTTVPWSNECKLMNPPIFHGEAVPWIPPDSVQPIDIVTHYPSNQFWPRLYWNQNSPNPTPAPTTASPTVSPTAPTKAPTKSPTKFPTAPTPDYWTTTATCRHWRGKWDTALWCCRSDSCGPQTSIEIGSCNRDTDFFGDDWC